jgi:hypothetical protein
LQRAIDLGASYYFVVDCDNFVLPHTLKDLISAQKPIVGPLLHCVGDPLLSNFIRELSRDESGKYVVPEKSLNYKLDKKHEVIVNMIERGRVLL